MLGVHVIGVSRENWNLFNRALGLRGLGYFGVDLGVQLGYCGLGLRGFRKFRSVWVFEVRGLG